MAPLHIGAGSHEESRVYAITNGTSEIRFKFHNVRRRLPPHQPAGLDAP